jgi:thioredoxin-related protein
MRKYLLLCLGIPIVQGCWTNKIAVGENKDQKNVDSATAGVANPSTQPSGFKDSGTKSSLENSVPFGRNIAFKDTSKTTATRKVHTPNGIPDIPAILTWLDFESGYTKAVKENKILMVDAYTDWCYWCKVMDKETFSDSAVIQQLNSSFVTVKLNPEKDKIFHFGDTTMNQVELYRWLGYGNIFGFPTTYFWINPAKSPERYSLAGYNEPAAFMEILEKIKAKRK